MPFNLDDYVDVAERVRLFYERYPDGRLATTLVKFCQWPDDGIFAQAEAYRTADDAHPSVGSAWEPVPGKTQFTRDSEVQNAETAAWGRAIAALGIGAKKIASKDDVRNRRADPIVASVTSTRTPPAATAAGTPAGGNRPSSDRGQAPAPGHPMVDEETKRAAAQRTTVDLREGPAAKLVTPAQIKKMFAVARGYGLKDDEIKAIIKRVADVDHTKDIPRYLMDGVLQEIEVEGLGTPS